MSLIEQVSKDIADAMRARAQTTLDVLRMLKTALTNREIEKGRALDEAEERQVLSTLVKQRRDSIEHFSKGGRQDLVDKETAEIPVLEAYLPPSADSETIDRAIDEAVTETGAISVKDMGRVMKAAMAKLAGETVDGKVVSERVRERLAR
jgi:uncharacterized protein YqeY